MRPIPLRDRVISALRLAPMTAGQLTLAVGSRLTTVQRALYIHRRAGRVRIVGGIRTAPGHRRSWLWGIAA